MPEWAWPFLVKHGVSTLQCTPYTAGNGTAPHHCETHCSSPKVPMKKYRAVNYTHAGDLFDASKHTAAIMRALLTGPLDATFIVYSDFDSYEAGQIYKHQSGDFEGLHSVKIVGYGESDTGEKYWTVANSWGTDWPFPGLPQSEAGYFKIVRGVDDCMFESQVYYGYADLQ
jgi:cathepsin B